jgi:hypothetical protein
MISERIREALHPGSRWLFGVGVPLLLGLILASTVAISWLTGSGFEPPAKLEAGRIADYPLAEPKLFEEHDVWVVHLSPVDFVALYDRGLESGCPLQWRREFAFMERAGWFVDACTGSAYDLTGRCFSDGCSGRPLDRFALTLAGGNVSVDLRAVRRGLPADLNTEPVNPPAE